MLLDVKTVVPPLRAGQIARPEHEASIARSWARPLTLLVAPGGFGKTSLALAALRHLNTVAIAWFSCEPSDNEPDQFLAYLLTACERAIPGCAVAALERLRTQPPTDTQAVLALWLNQLQAQSRPLLLILDDYHSIDEPAIHMLLTFILEHQPSTLRLGVLSRSTPPLPLARLRARGQLGEFDAAALRFQHDEVARFFHETMGLALAEGTIATLEQRTEGWVAGLQLAGLALTGAPDSAAVMRAFGGSHHFVSDYLVEEVLQRHPPALQEFLLATSLLSRMCGALCAAVLERSTAEATALLEAAERAGLFVFRLDTTGTWFRYHQLFAEALRAQLQRTRPALIPTLHARAARWWLAQAEWREAYAHAQASGDRALLLQVVADAAGPLLFGGAAGTVLRWLNDLTPAERAAMPLLLLFEAWARLLTGDIALVEPILCQLEAALPSAYPSEAEAAYGQIAAVRSYRQLLEGQIAEALATAQPAILALPRYEPLMQAVTGINLSVVAMVAGQLVQAETLLHATVATAQTIGNLGLVVTAQQFLGQIARERADLVAASHLQEDVRASAHAALTQRLTAIMNLADIAYERDDLTQAVGFTAEALALAHQCGATEWVALCQVLNAKIAWTAGNEATCTALLADAAVTLQAVQPVARPMVAAVRAQVLALRGEREEAIDPQLLSAAPAGFASLAQRPLYLAAAEALRLEGDPAALPFIEALLPIAEQAGRISAVIELLVLLALSAPAGSDLAAQATRRAVQLGAAAGFRRTFLDRGAAFQALILRYAAGSTAGRTIAALYPAALPAIALPGGELLHPREQEVLRLVAGGASNRAIATELTVAIGTVKKHLNNIFGKLGVSNRTEAVARARELGLL